MRTVTVHMSDNEKPCARKKTKHSTQPTAPCVYKHARSHMTNTLSSQSKPVSLLICLYIYLYLVKNKLHNSTDLENCFFKLKMTKRIKKKQKCNYANHCLGFSHEREVFSKIKEWGAEGEKHKTSLSPHLQIELHSSPSARKTGQKTRKKKKKRPYKKRSFF